MPYLKYVNSWAKTQLSCSFMHLLFQELITVIPNYLAFLIMSSIDFNFQNSEARLVFRARIHDNVTPLLVNLYWLQMQCRIQFKILLMTCKVLRGQVPWYLRDLVTPYAPTRRLRSQNKLSIHQPRFHLKRYGQRALKLLLHASGMICLIKSININYFKKKLKTDFFKKAFAIAIWHLLHFWRTNKLASSFDYFT